MPDMSYIENSPWWFSMLIIVFPLALSIITGLWLYKDDRRRKIVISSAIAVYLWWSAFSYLDKLAQTLYK